MSMNENYELLIPTDDGYKDVKKISIDGVNVWKRAIPNTKSGTVPLSIAPTRVKPLLDWSITGNTVQESEPSPDAPVEAKGVGDETGNLTKISSAYFPMNKSTHYYLFDGWLDAGTYTISCFQETEMSENVRNTFGVNIGDTGIQYQNTSPNRHLKKGTYSYTFTVSKKSIAKVELWITGNIVDVNCSKIMLNEGSEPLPYEPFGKYRISVVSGGNNLYNPNTITKGYYINSQGVETQSTVSGYAALNHTEKIKISPSTAYTLRVYEYISANTCAFCWYKDDDLLTRDTFDISSGLDGYQRTYISPSNANYLIINFFTTNYEKIIIELGDTIKEPITTPLYLSSPLMAYEKLISDGTREVKWGKMILTGDESWIHPSNTTTFYITNLPIDYNKRLNNPESNYYSTHFAASSASTSSSGMKEGEIRFYNGVVNTQEMYIKILGIDTVDGFKAWLRQQNANGTPVVVYYQLANPLTEAFDVPEIPTVKGNCVMDTDTEVKPKDMNVTYLGIEGTKQHTTFKLGNGDILETQDNRQFCVI